MKVKIGSALAIALLLAGCAAPKPDAKQAATPAATGQADSGQVASADTPKKKRCSNQTGSRLAPCGESTPEVMGSSGDDYRQGMIGKSVGPNVSPN